MTLVSCSVTKSAITTSETIYSAIVGVFSDLWYGTIISFYSRKSFKRALNSAWLQYFPNNSAAQYRGFALPGTSRAGGKRSFWESAVSKLYRGTLFMRDWPRVKRHVGNDETNEIGQRTLVLHDALNINTILFAYSIFIKSEFKYLRKSTCCAIQTIEMCGGDSIISELM